MNYTLLAPEIFTVLGGFILLIAGLVLPDRGQKYVGPVAVVFMTAILAWVLFHYDGSGTLFGGIYQVDLLSNFFRVLFLCAGILSILMAGRYSQKFRQRRSEWYSFVFFACLGMMIMAASSEMITLYVGLELMTITFYILSAYLLGSAKSAEAGLKYLILGAISSAILLFGMSLVYAATGETMFSQIYLASVPGHEGITGSTSLPVLLAGLGLILAGFGFKISAVPFHMWAPDVYEGAPSPVTAFLSVASKAAGFAALVRMLMAAFPPAVLDWQLLMSILAAATIIFGNLAALVQKDLKRMLAYSSIAQAGYILVGLVAANTYGFNGVLFYSLIYVFANCGAFAVISEVEIDSGNTTRTAFNNLGERAPLLAAAMTICLLSLAGIPPLAGFAGKFYLFAGAMEAGYFWLAFIGLIMSMISVYYYLNVARDMYIGKNAGAGPLTVSPSSRVALWICMAVTLTAGIYPQPLAALANAASQLL